MYLLSVRPKVYGCVFPMIKGVGNVICHASLVKGDYILTALKYGCEIKCVVFHQSYRYFTKSKMKYLNCGFGRDGGT